MPTDSPLSPGLDDELKKLLRHTRPRITALFTRYRIPAEDAEDLLQDALLSLVSRWASVAHPEAWLLQTMRYSCYRYLRRERYEKRLHTVDPAILEMLCAPYDPPQEQRDLEMDLETLLSLLPAVSRRVLRMCLVEGLTSGEAGKRVRCRPEWVKGNVRRSLEVLKRRAPRRQRFRGSTRGDQKTRA